MNTKRQTIWLVSMLSLMVVLSAYYLFSTSSNDLNTVSTQGSGQTVQDEVKIDMSQVDTNAAVTGDKAVAISNDGSMQTTAKAGGDKQGTGTDAQSVQGKAQSSDDFFLQQEMNRHEQLTKDTEKWMNISVDPKQTQEAVSQADNNILRIQETTAKVDNIEAELGKQYKHAIVTQEEGRWKVTVQSSKLDKKQAVAIIDLVMKELNVGPEQIAGVQYRQ
jgi:stage III sporulation protein AH